MRLARMEEILLAHGHVAEANRIESAYRTVWKRCHELYWSADNDVPCRRQIEVFLEELGIDGTALEPENAGRVGASLRDCSSHDSSGRRDRRGEILSSVKALGLRHGPDQQHRPHARLCAAHDSRGARACAESSTRWCSRTNTAPASPARRSSNNSARCLGVEYDEMLFIGDNLFVDVLGAKRCGMSAVHFVPPVRGTAVAPAVDHEEVEADAR